MAAMIRHNIDLDTATKSELGEVKDNVDKLSKESFKTDGVLEYEPLNPGDEEADCFYHRHGDCGYDLYTSETKWVFPWKVTKIPVNVKVSLPSNTFGLITLRSSMYDKGINVLNGAIDEIYRGTPHIAAHRIGFLPKKIPAGSRIGQLIIIPYTEAQLVKSIISSDTIRGDGRFGSTN